MLHPAPPPAIRKRWRSCCGHWRQGFPPRGLLPAWGREYLPRWLITSDRSGRLLAAIKGADNDGPGSSAMASSFLNGLGVGCGYDLSRHAQVEIRIVSQGLGPALSSIRAAATRGECPASGP